MGKGDQTVVMLADDSPQVTLASHCSQWLHRLVTVVTFCVVVVLIVIVIYLCHGQNQIKEYIELRNEEYDDAGFSYAVEVDAMANKTKQRDQVHFHTFCSFIYAFSG